MAMAWQSAGERTSPWAWRAVGGGWRVGWCRQTRVLWVSLDQDDALGCPRQRLLGRTQRGAVASEASRSGTRMNLSIAHASLAMNSYSMFWRVSHAGRLHAPTCFARIAHNRTCCLVCVRECACAHLACVVGAWRLPLSPLCCPTLSTLVCLVSRSERMRSRWVRLARDCAHACTRSLVSRWGCLLSLIEISYTLRHISISMHAIGSE